MNSTNSNNWLWRYTQCALASGLLIVSAHAQERERDSALVPPVERLQEIRELVLSLDEQAKNCLETAPVATPNNPHCQRLIAAIDGEEIANYLQHCAQLKEWRDHFITSYQEGDTGGELTDTAALEALVQTEYWCGENALRERTASVFPAFAALNEGSQVNRSASNAINPPANSSPSSARASDARRMQDRLRMETERLWLDLRIENLRQQLP